MRATIYTAIGQMALLAALPGCNDLPQNPPITMPPPVDAAIADAFLYPDTRPAPGFSLQFIDPDYGPFTGSTEILVRGEGFTNATEVFIGGRAVEPLYVQHIDSRRISVRTPPGEPGLADVEVRDGSQSALLPAAFTYEAVIVDPPTGSVAGGTFVTITGLGTSFDQSTTVTLDGVELTGVTVVSELSITGYTPPGIGGTADLRVVTQSGVYEARRAYTYETTGDSFAGGMSGGPINGTVNVVVIDENSGNGIDGAYVAVGDPASSPYQGFTDNLGQITFSDPSLVGPISVIAAAQDYETTSFISYDAQNISIQLRTPPPPVDGPIPAGPQVGQVLGHVLFGDSTSIGTPDWNLVPEPRTPTERKRVYVTTAARSPFATPFPPSAFIDYEYNPNVVAWEYNAYLRPSATALVAIAGLYDPARDPSGAGVTGFEPFAMGIARGVLVGPGETRMGVDIVVNIPLDTAMLVELADPPALGTEGWAGPTYYQVRPYIDLGGEGVIFMNKHGLPTPAAPETPPGRYVFPPGATSLVLGGMAPLTGPLADASYGFFVGAYSENGNSPFSVRITRGVTDLEAPVVIDDFLGVPRPMDPAPDTTGSSRAMRFAPEGPPATAPTYHLHVLTSAEGDPLARIFTRGDLYDVPLPNVTFGGLPPLPSAQDISWTIWSILVSGSTFDQFTYRHLGSLYWESYAADAFFVQFPSE